MQGYVPPPSAPKHPKLGSRSVIIDFNKSGLAAEQWVLTDDGAMRLDDYYSRPERQQQEKAARASLTGKHGQQPSPTKALSGLVTPAPPAASAAVAATVAKPGRVARERIDPSDLLALGIVGEGSGGRVTKCLHIKTMRLMAVKTMPMTSAAKRAATKRELEVLYGQLANEETRTSGGHENNIVSFYDAYSTEDGKIHIILEYMGGGSLQDLLDLMQRHAAPDDIGVAVPISKSMVSLIVVVVS